MVRREKKPLGVETHIEELVRLTPEHRSKYEPTLLERRLLETFSLKEIDEVLRRATFSSPSTLPTTVVFPHADIFGEPYWDKQTDEIVLPVLKNEREILVNSFRNFTYMCDFKFSGIKESIRKLAQFIKDLKAIEPLLKDDSIFI